MDRAYCTARRLSQGNLDTEMPSNVTNSKFCHLQTMKHHTYRGLHYIQQMNKYSEENNKLTNDRSAISIIIHTEQLTREHL